MKVLLFQLPVQGHDFFFSHENIPLASAYLQEIARRQGVDAELLPGPLMSYGSDQAILQYLLDVKPDVVGMSCYQWNLERSLFLARQLKQLLPACTVVMGGPEIAPDNKFLLRHKEFDIGVVGEGEEVWELLLECLPRVPDVPGLLLPGKNGQWLFTGRRLPSSAVGHWPSPFLAGGLDSHLDKVLWIETVRGCIHRCAYCYYHKQSPSLRTFPLERIGQEVGRAWGRGFEEIVFLDPCFAGRPGLEELLNELAAINYDRRLHFHAECNVEEIEPWIAERMGRAGFKEMEVGLQSIKRETLRRIHRSFDPQRFLRGIRSLQDWSIEVKVDVIAGLPGDYFPDICRSIDWVLGQEAYDSLMLYPLSVMPATELCQRAGELGLTMLPQPPYLLTRGPGMTAPEMCSAFHYYAERMEEDVSPLEMPPSLNPLSEDSSFPGGLCNAMNWGTPDQVRSFSSSGNHNAYSLAIRLTREVLRQPGLWSSILRDYLEHNPFTLFSVEVPPEVFPDELNPLWELAQRHDHVISRDYTVIHSPYRSFLLFSRDKGIIWKWPDPRESNSIVLPDGQEVPCHPVCLVAGPEKVAPRWFLSHMAQRYPFPPEVRQWELPDDCSH